MSVDARNSLHYHIRWSRLELHVVYNHFHWCSQLAQGFTQQLRSLALPSLEQLNVQGGSYQKWISLLFLIVCPPYSNLMYREAILLVFPDALSTWCITKQFYYSSRMHYQICQLEDTWHAWMQQACGNSRTSAEGRVSRCQWLRILDKISKLSNILERGDAQMFNWMDLSNCQRLKQSC